MKRKKIMEKNSVQKEKDDLKVLEDALIQIDKSISVIYKKELDSFNNFLKNYSPNTSAENPFA